MLSIVKERFCIIVYCYLSVNLLNIHMTHKLLVATYQDDLRQFEMFCHCLDRNWQGSKNLIVAMGKQTDRATVQNIVDQRLTGWSVEIKDTACVYMDGYTEQQVNKIVHSISSGADDVIVFDSKDFLLRSCDFSVFKHDEKYRVTFYIPDQRLIELFSDIQQIVDHRVDHLPSVINLTPWIWKTDCLDRYWKYINDRFGDYRTWANFPAGTEIYGFYVYAWCDETNTISWHGPDSTPLLVGGGWTHQTHEGMLQESQDFDRWPERVIWKHSRKLKDTRCLDVTRSVLLKYGIERETIDRVFGS